MSRAHFSATNKHLPVVLADGARTSVCIQAAVYAAFLAQVGGDRLRFNAHLRAAALTAQPRLGVSRSQAIRFALEARLGLLPAQGGVPPPAQA